MFRKKEKKRKRKKIPTYLQMKHKQMTTKAKGSKCFTDSWSMGNNA